MAITKDNARGSNEPLGVGALTRQTLESFVDLVGAQVRLAKAELAVDSKTYVTRGVQLLLFAPLLVVGHIFACAALSAVLAPAVGWAAALGIIAAANVAVGCIGCAVMWGKFKRMEPINHTIASVGKSVRQIETALHRSDKSS